MRCRNALNEAVSKGNMECVEILIKAGADVNNVDHEELLRLTVEHDNVSCTDLLIKTGVNVNSGYYFKPLYYAVTKKANRCLDLLLRSGADVNNVDLGGKTALTYVKDEECCRLLLKHHIQINRRDWYGDNALTRYIYDDPVNKNVCSLLFAAGETVPKADIICFKEIESINVTGYLPQIKIDFYLTALCRETVRKHLLKLDLHTNLFDRIPRLGLPSSLTEYLLYYMSLDSASQPDNCTK